MTVSAQGTRESVRGETRSFVLVARRVRPTGCQARWPALCGVAAGSPRVPGPTPFSEVPSPTASEPLLNSDRHQRALTPPAMSITDFFSSFLPTVHADADPEPAAEEPKEEEAQEEPAEEEEEEQPPLNRFAPPRPSTGIRLPSSTPAHSSRAASSTSAPRTQTQETRSQVRSQPQERIDQLVTAAGSVPWHCLTARN